jgi:hypothetical protein
MSKSAVPATTATFIAIYSNTLAAGRNILPRGRGGSLTSPTPILLYIIGRGDELLIASITIDMRLHAHYQVARAGVLVLVTGWVLGYSVQEI